MKIAINCIYYTPKGGGITEYIYNLVKELVKIDSKNSFIIYTTKESKESLRLIVGAKARIKVFPYSENQKYRRAFFQHSFWKKEELEEKFDIFHSPFFHAPVFKHAKTILTVHDLRFLNYPKSYKIARLIYLRYAVKKSVKKASKIICISEFTKNELIKNYGVEQSRLEVIHEAVDREGFNLSDKSKNRVIKDVKLRNNQFFLSVGHLEPRKNYNNLILAYSSLSESIRKKYPLIIVGKKNHDYKNDLKLIEKSIGVFYLEFISREDLIWLYANCKVHIFPSIYEGFGFPTLEAGLYAKPTIGANQSSIPEIAGKGAIYFDPFSIEDIRNTILKVISDSALYDHLSQFAKSNVKRFSWEENALKTMNIYHSFK
ncbi:glycosyltransferase family 1 protein [uncultured Draconibacterium sp.]|uniref:glycosyltransferase family 4 protein n=1 Tax=uncultured Draconibacterium sp. TaxID=1573823 RepID=UPI0029C81D82|nr:glycosyltransferase family 1 protein [uncultured Draconibacterium sp.]